MALWRMGENPRIKGCLLRTYVLYSRSWSECLRLENGLSKWPWDCFQRLERYLPWIRSSQGRLQVYTLRFKGRQPGLWEGGCGWMEPECADWIVHTHVVRPLLVNDYTGTWTGADWKPAASICTLVLGPINLKVHLLALTGSNGFYSLNPCHPFVLYFFLFWSVWELKKSCFLFI